MILTEGRTGGYYRIRQVTVSAPVAGRLEAMGIRNGTVVKLVAHRKNGAAVIYFHGTRIALGKQITASVAVSEVVR